MIENEHAVVFIIQMTNWNSLEIVKDSDSIPCSDDGGRRQVIEVKLVVIVVLDEELEFIYLLLIELLGARNHSTLVSTEFVLVGRDLKRRVRFRIEVLLSVGSDAFSAVAEV
jgi:hypothetical protein